LQLNKLKAIDYIEMVKKREVSAEQVFDDIFRQINSKDKKLKAYLSLNQENALSEAKEIDKKIAKGEKIPPLAGLPVAIKDIISIKGVFPLAAMYFCFGFSYIITATYMVTFLVAELGCSQELAGQIWGISGMLGIGSGLVWGMLSDRLGRRSMLVTIFLIQAGCYLLLQARFTDGFLLWLPAILFGLTAWSIPGLAASCCGDLSDAKRAPAVLGFITFVFGLGQVLGPVSAGYIKEFTGSFAWAFVLAAVVAVSGALFSSRLIIPNWRDGR